MKKILFAIAMIFTLVSSAQQITDSVYIGDFIEPSPAPFSVQNLNECRQIRVVVHVVFDSMDGTFTTTDISESQVRSQIRATNQIFRNDSLFFIPENAGLEYTVKLAETDPDGMITNGIIYHDGVELFGEDWHTYGLRNSGTNGISQTNLAQSVGWGADINGKKFLNSYVVPKIDGNSGGGVQAFAYFPTNSVVYGNYNLYNTFGSKYFEGEDEIFQLKTYTNEGKVWSHELLHNGAIFHTFQGNSCDEVNCEWSGDRVCDTPAQTQGGNCSTGSCGFLSSNLMDYIPEQCKDIITQGQSDRFSLAVINNLEDYLVCSECTPITNGDFNQDGVVNIVDVSLMNTSFGCSQGDDCYDSTYDLNCDGGINIQDISMFIANWPVQASTISEGVQVDILGRKMTQGNSGFYITNKGKRFIYED